MTRKKTICSVFDFLGGRAIAAAASNDAGPWVKTLTGSATVSVAAGELVLALDATNEAQNACASFDDVLSFDIDDLVRVTFWARLSVALGAAAKARFGLAGARNDDPDAIAQSLFFGATGDANVDVEADDGTNELAATDTGLDLATTLGKFVFDFSEGIASASPPSLSTGGKSQIRALACIGENPLRQVVPNSRLNLGAYTGGLQLYAQIQKTAGTNLGSLAIRRIEVEHKVPA